MERIKEALDRVKAEREASGDKASPERGKHDLPSNTASSRAIPSDTAEPAVQPARPTPRTYRATSTSVADGRAQIATREVLPCDPRHLERNRIVSHQKHNPHSGAFDLLRTQVLHKMTRNGWNTIGIVSPAPGAGKTVVAINLALSIAQLQDRTSMLLDFDLRRPSVLKYLGLHPATSLNEVLADECDFAEALINPLLPSLSVVAADRPVANSAELLSSERLAVLMDEVKGRYPDRIVVVDLPPVLNADDALAVMPNLDCVLLVVGAGMSAKREVEDTLRHLPATNLLGSVLNKAQGSAEAYSYGY